MPGSLSKITSSKAANEEAIRIGKAILNTFNKNRAPFPIIRGARDERNKGFWCYEWAYAFESAFNLESSGKYFKATVEGASTVWTGNPDGKVHFWLKIQSLETGKITYVDDGFMNGSYVHTKRPEGGSYKYDPFVVSDQPRSNCNPPSAYNANGITKKRPFTGPIPDMPGFYSNRSNSILNRMP